MTTTITEDAPPTSSLHAITEGVRALGPAKLAAMGLVSLGMLCMLALLAIRGGGSGAPDGNALLYGDLDTREAASMSDLLDKAHIAHTLNAADDAITVNARDVAAARLLLARSGLPTGGSVGDEIFDKMDGLTTTEFQQDVNRTRALEGEVARSIRLIDGVRNARVHLVLPKREPFATTETAAQASVLLELRGQARPDAEAVQAILNLVSAAVPGLKPQAIAIIDNRGDVLARAGAPVEGAGLATGADELRQTMELRLAHQVEDLLDASLGPDKVRAEASVTLDTDQVAETKETYDPDQQVLRSQQTTSDKSQRREADQNTSVANNLPNADAGHHPAGSQDERREETDNYEIGKTVRTVTDEAPRIKRVTLAVMVDGDTVADSAGHPVWRKRTDAELAEMTTLVKSAIGFDGKRGDTVTVVSMPFTAPVDFGPAPPPPRRVLGLAEADAVRLGQSALIALAALASALLVFRPMIGRLLPNNERNATSGEPVIPTGGGGTAIRTGDGREPGSALPTGDGPRRLSGPATTAGDAGDRGVTLAVSQVDGRVQAHAIRRVTQLVEQFPDESLSVVRGWLSEEARP